ncbi:MAG: hypothetical protein ACSHW7_04905 [Patiriisocius sp.]|uniref:hypothetical protein n=1 Tax=Patiriisocius sp. TaxID=2822396 RepID=UPI003EF5FBE2
MEKYTIEFEVTKRDAGLLLGILSNFLKNTTSQQVKKSIIPIYREIQNDVGLEDLIFGKVVNTLAHSTNRIIKKSSTLRQGLGLKLGFIRIELPRRCNFIAQNLVQQLKPGKRHKLIKRKEVEAAVKVEDLIGLIKKSYEAAK